MKRLSITFRIYFILLIFLTAISGLTYILFSKYQTDQIEYENEVVRNKQKRIIYVGLEDLAARFTLILGKLNGFSDKKQFTKIEQDSKRLVRELSLFRDMLDVKLVSLINGIMENWKAYRVNSEKIGGYRIGLVARLRVLSNRMEERARLNRWKRLSTMMSRVKEYEYAYILGGGKKKNYNAIWASLRNSLVITKKSFLASEDKQSISEDIVEYRDILKRLNGRILKEKKLSDDLLHQLAETREIIGGAILSLDSVYERINSGMDKNMTGLREYTASAMLIIAVLLILFAAIVNYWRKIPKKRILSAVINSWDMESMLKNLSNVNCTETNEIKSALIPILEEYKLVFKTKLSKTGDYRDFLLSNYEGEVHKANQSLYDARIEYDLKLKAVLRALEDIDDSSDVVIIENGKDGEVLNQILNSIRGFKRKHLGYKRYHLDYAGKVSSVVESYEEKYNDLFSKITRHRVFFDRIGVLSGFLVDSLKFDEKQWNELNGEIEKVRTCWKDVKGKTPVSNHDSSYAVEVFLDDALIGCDGVIKATDMLNHVMQFVVYNSVNIMLAVSRDDLSREDIHEKAESLCEYVELLERAVERTVGEAKGAMEKLNHTKKIVIQQEEGLKNESKKLCDTGSMIEEAGDAMLKIYDTVDFYGRTIKQQDAIVSEMTKISKQMLSFIKSMDSELKKGKLLNMNKKEDKNDPRAA